MDESGKMKISELERESGVPRSRIYYYIKEGLLHPPKKTAQTMAYYDKEHLEKLRVMEKIKFDHMKMSGKLRMPTELLRKKLEMYDRSEK